MSTKTNVNDFISELSAGTFEEKLGLILSEVALGTVNYGTDKRMKGKVNIEFTITQMGDNNQVIVSAKLGKVTPTRRGRRMEEDSTETPFHIGKGGVLTINPPREDMEGQFNLTEVK